jgi:hypothetical protein
LGPAPGRFALASQLASLSLRRPKSPSQLFAAISGLITQWMIDPERAPNADDLMHAT